MIHGNFKMVCGKPDNLDNSTLLDSCTKLSVIYTLFMQRKKYVIQVMLYFSPFVSIKLIRYMLT